MPDACIVIDPVTRAVPVSSGLTLRTAARRVTRDRIHAPARPR
ncbi:hypothetical protein BDI4_320090 [Burkholderia diffusa]|nr:hypothetical protein BDI4_320090 [Burkholderia diffusa]